MTSHMTNRLRRAVAVASVATLGLFGAACSDDDGDGNQEIEVPDVTSPDVEAPDVDVPDVDVDPGQLPDVDVEGGEMPDVDVDDDNDDN